MAIRIARGDKDAISSTFLGVAATYLLTAILSLSFSSPTSALQFVPGSPCESSCSSADGGSTYQNDTVCLDEDYRNEPGSRVRDCTTCLLNSTAVDQANNVSDVEWGLFNLRYTLSECMFAYPTEIVSVSSPCQVLCQPLSSAVSHGIGQDVQSATDGVVPNLDFCQNGFGGYNAINNCSFCYSFVPQQLFLANFLQALHIACRQPPTLGQTFYPDGRAIFNQSAIPGPGPPGSGQVPASGMTGWKLGLVIALPIVGAAILLAASCFCCFRFTKKRRQRMAATGRMSRFHDQHAPAESAFNSPVTTRVPPSQYEWPIDKSDPPREMERWSYQQNTPQSGKIPSPGLAQGRWSQHAAEDEDEVPLSGKSLPRDDIGPGQGQSKDPFLHDQYFGVASSGLEEPEASSFVPHAGPSVHPDK